MPEDIISRVGPYRSLSFAWKSNLISATLQVDLEERGQQGIQIVLNDNVLNVLKVYFPVNRDDNDIRQQHKRSCDYM